MLETAKLPVDYFLCDGQLEYQVPNWLFALTLPHVPERLTSLRFPFASKDKPSTRRLIQRLPFPAGGQSFEVARTTGPQANSRNTVRSWLWADMRCLLSALSGKTLVSATWGLFERGSVREADGPLPSSPGLHRSHGHTTGNAVCQRPLRCEGTPNKRGEAPDMTDVVLLSVRSQPPHYHVILHALAKRCGPGIVGEAGH